jgi:serine protease Do
LLEEDVGTIMVARKTSEEKKAMKRDRLSAVMLVGIGVVTGLVLSVGFGVRQPAAGVADAAPGQEPARAEARLGAAAGSAGVPSFADLADRVLPAVVSIDAVTIEKADRRPGGQDPFEFFFGPRGRRSPHDGEQDPDEPKGRQREFRSDSGGSGFVISADGLIVTNNHVVQGATKLNIRLGERTYEAQVRGVDPETDLALIQIDAGRKLPFLLLGDSDALRVGEWVMAVGNPMNLAQTVTVGVVSAKNRQIGLNNTSFENYIQTDAAINRGNSGGPLVNLAGEVVGISTAMNGAAENIGFAVPVSTLHSVLPQLRASGKVSRGYLGIGIVNLDSDSAEAFGVDAGSGGILVQQVTQDTPAANAGVQHGDVILEVDGRPVKLTRDLIDYVSSRGPGATVRLLILRDGRRSSYEVKLSERPAGDAVAGDEGEGEAEPGKGVEWLGMQYQDLTAALRRNHGIADSVEGVWVADVQGSSPLFEEGVRPGDVITEVNGSPVKTASAFEGAVGKARSGSLLRLYIRRFGARGGEFGTFAIVRVP